MREDCRGPYAAGPARVSLGRGCPTPPTIRRRPCLSRAGAGTTLGSGSPGHSPTNGGFMSACLRRGRLLLSLATMAAALGAACSGTGSTGPDTGYSVGYQNRYYNGMRYGLFVPPGYTPSRKYPLILYLHGSTDTTTWDFGWYHDPIQARDPVFVLTPKAGSQSLGWGSSWDAWLPVDMLNALEILASTR